jgi:hypothetical protein
MRVAEKLAPGQLPQRRWKEESENSSLDHEWKKELAS